MSLSETAMATALKNRSWAALLRNTAGSAARIQGCSRASRRRQSGRGETGGDAEEGVAVAGAEAALFDVE
eukprot:919039-Rhodomonas_salina.4